MIIFSSIRFLSKESNQTEFKKKTKTGSNRLVSVQFGFLGQKPVQTSLVRFFRFSFFGFLVSRFGFFGYCFFRFLGLIDFSVFLFTLKKNGVFIFIFLKCSYIEWQLVKGRIFFFPIQLHRCEESKGWSSHTFIIQC